MRDTSVPILLAALAALAAGAGCQNVWGIQELGPGADYYPCDCNCSATVTAPGAPVYQDPASAFLAFAPSTGTADVLDGPVAAELNGNLAQWWRLQFSNGLTGWTAQGFITAAAGSGVFAKEADACLPPALNPFLGGTGAPTIDDVRGFCHDDVGPAGARRVDEKLGMAVYCDCLAQLVPDDRFSDASCEVACPGGAPVCLRAGSDPPDPVPEDFAAALFQPVSECAVAGDAVVVASGHTPKRQPHVTGTLEIQGSPCPPGENCRVGVSYVLASDDIEFDSGTIFASDPKFVDIGVTGASVPDAVELGPFLAGELGELPAGTTFSTGQGRRSGSTQGFLVRGTNSEGLALALDREDKTCRIAGELVGQVAGEESDGTLDASVEVALDGVLVNQPPRPDAGADQTVECSGAGGAAVTLDASASSDADGNIALYAWRAGSADGAQLAPPSQSPLLAVQQALGVETYHLLVVDTRAAADEDTVQVTVTDTTPPDVDCNAPATITPSQVKGALSFTATADDGCTGVASVTVDGLTCARPGGCAGATLDGATVTLHASGGVGDQIRWTVTAVDGAGNAAQKTCTVDVVRKKDL